MDDKTYNKLREYMKKLNKRIKTGSKEGLQMLIDAGIYTKDGELTGPYKNKRNMKWKHYIGRKNIQNY
jgi:gamma-glutamylcysteine synthetase